LPDRPRGLGSPPDIRPVWRIIRLVGGIVLIIAGLIGTLLPVVPGFVLLIPGLALLGSVYPPARRLLVRLRRWIRRRGARAESGAGPGRE